MGIRRAAFAAALVVLTMLAVAASAAASDGIFDRTWGRDVIDTGRPGDLGDVFEICVVATDCDSTSGSAGGGQMDSPNDVAVGEFGLTYVADRDNERIQEYAADGSFLGAWGWDVVQSGVDNNGTGFEACRAGTTDVCKSGVAGGGSGQFNRPVAIAVSATDFGDLIYVADSDNSRVQEFSQAGSFLRTWGRDVVQSGVDNNGTAFEICRSGTNDVCKTGANGTGLTGDMFDPLGIATDTGGRVYVSDFVDDRIQRFSGSGTPQLVWGKDVIDGSGSGEFEICNPNTQTCQAAAGGNTGLGGEMSGPKGVGADFDGNVYVADEGQNRIQKFGTNGSISLVWGKDVVPGGGTGPETCLVILVTCKAGAAGSAGGEMTSPNDVAADGIGGVYVADSGDRIVKFNGGGVFLRLWGRSVVDSGPDDTANGRMEVCVAGSDVCRSGTAGSFGGEFNSPQGVGATEAGDLLVANFGDNRIDRFSDSAGGGGGGGTGGGAAGGGGAGAGAGAGSGAAVTGQQAAALKKCKKKFQKNKNKNAFKKCKKKAKKLPL